MEILLSYAQQQEDIILYHLLKDVTAPIRYVDVGANDPIKISVTKFFYDRGGSGINIEPQQKLIEVIKKDRPRDINLAIGVSDKAGELALHGEGFLATFDNNCEFVDQGITNIVPVMTLSDVFNEYIQKDEDVHFLKIDVEGWEYECVKGMDFQQFRPWILCIESVEAGSHELCYEKWEGMVLEQNYVFIGATDLNRYYVAAERLNGLREFRKGEELEAIYKILYYEGGNWIDSHISRRVARIKRREKIHKVIATTSIFLDQTPVGHKTKSFLQSTFIWRAVRKRL